MVSTHGDYEVGWISALPIEETFAKAMLDKIHPKLPTPRDNNSYIFGEVTTDDFIDGRPHNVVVLCLGFGVAGKASAATAAEGMRRSFRSIKIGLMVGIAGGVWSKEHDVRHGDIVVGVSEDGGPGVIQYDHGKTLQEETSIKMKGTMNKPPAILLNAVSQLESQSEEEKKKWVGYSQSSKMRVTKPQRDLLFKTNYRHRPVESSSGDQHTAACQNCDSARSNKERHNRPVEQRQIPLVHYGLIASGDQVMKSAMVARAIQEEYGISCFEMEAGGSDAFPSLAVRRISDYADSHKNDDWHPYAAAAAAAYAKYSLTHISPSQMTESPVSDEQASEPATHNVTHRGDNRDNATAFYGNSTFSGSGPIIIGGSRGPR